MSDSIRLCLDNAERLNNDAELLLDKERFVSSAVLVAFGKEELGKAILMMDYWVCRRKLSYKEYMKNEVSINPAKLVSELRRILAGSVKLILGRVESVQREGN